MRFLPEGGLINTKENSNAFKSSDTLREAMHEQKILEAKALLCSSNHDLILDLNGFKGVIPREEGAIGIREGHVRDIAILSRVNHPICFMIDEIQTDINGQPVAFLSRRRAQERCHAEYISNLKNGTVLDVVVTHIEPFGVFADIGCGIISLLPIDSISISRIDHPKERFAPGMKIKAIVKSQGGGRITLSHKELLGTWAQNAEAFSAGETVSGIVRSVENYGIFVELTPNLAGLAELRENIIPGQEVSVFIKSILPGRMKIKLIIIESFPRAPIIPKEPAYYFSENYMDIFHYSPPECEKKVFTVFE
jgi:Ribosomal protein S1